MKLAHWSFGDAELTPLSPLVITAEKPELYYGMLCDLNAQLEGEEGDFRFISGGESISFHKIGGFLSDFVHFSCGEKRVMNVLQKELKSTIAERSVEVGEYLQQGWNIVRKWAETAALPLTVDLPAPIELAKWFAVRIEEGKTLLERIARYLDALSEYCGIKVLVLAALKTVMNEEERRQLYRHARYRAVSLVLIEPFERKAEANERTLLVDKDLCLVYHKTDLEN